MVRYCPIDAYSLAVACGSRGVSCDIWPASHSAPAAPRAVRLSGHDRDRSPSRTTRRATTWFPPRRLSPAGAGSLPRLGGLPGRRYASVRALPRMWRTVPCDASTALRCCLAARHLVSTLGAAITRRALRPGNVACGDSDCGAPYHRVITLAPTIFLAKPLTRLAARPIWRPVTTGFPRGSAGTPHRECDVPRRGRPAVTGRCASDRPTDEHRHGADRRLVGAGRLHVRPAGVRRTQDAPAALDGHQPHAPASRRRDRPPAPPRCGRRPPARRDRRTRSRLPPARRAAMRGRAADEPLRSSFVPMTSTRLTPTGLRRGNRWR